jgi:Na+-driven multidrug efflux pump
VRLNFRRFRPDWHSIKGIYQVGLPSIIMQSIGSVMTFGMNKILIAFTETAVSVFGVYFKLQSFVFMPVFGLNNGMVPIIGYNYGANKPERIHKTIKLSMLYATLLMVIGFAVFQLLPEQLLLLFDASEDMLKIGGPALRIISFSFLLAGLNIIASSSCQAFGYGMYSLYISAARQLVILVPAAYLLSLTGTLSNVWLSFPVAEAVSVFVCQFLLRHVLKKTGMEPPKKKKA